MTTRINLTAETVRPTVDVLTMTDERRFLVLTLGPVEVILPGFDDAAVTFAQQLAQAVDNAGLEISYRRQHAARVQEFNAVFPPLVVEDDDTPEGEPVACAICGGAVDGLRTVGGVGHVCSSRCANIAVENARLPQPDAIDQVRR